MLKVSQVFVQLVQLCPTIPQMFTKYVHSTSQQATWLRIGLHGPVASQCWSCSTRKSQRNNSDIHKKMPKFIKNRRFSRTFFWARLSCCSAPHLPALLASQRVCHLPEKGTERDPWTPGIRNENWHWVANALTSSVDKVIPNRMPKTPKYPCPHVHDTKMKQI